jgi:hypothetical protein
MSRKENGFLMAEKRADSVYQPKQELIKDTPVLDKQTLFIRPVKIGKQLTIDVAIEDIKTKKNIKATTLVDSGCMRTCIDESFTRDSGLVLTKIIKPIRVEYADGTSVEDSTIRYSTDIRIWVAGATVVTGALVMRLKSAKVFLGFDWLQSVNPKIDWRSFRVEAEEGTETFKMRTTEITSENSEEDCSKDVKEGAEPLEEQSLDETPNYLTIFKKVFSEDGFNDLPPRRKWDHAINLIPNHGPV